MSLIEATLFGDFALQIAEQTHTQFRTSKVQALLAYLIVERENAVRREQLYDLLWPGLPLQSAQVNLRQTLYQARKVLSAAHKTPIVSERGMLQLNPELPLSADVIRFDALLRANAQHEHVDLRSCQLCRERLEEAVSLYTGPLLANVYLSDSNEFEDWAAGRRAATERSYFDALATLTTIYLRNGRYSEAEAGARRQLEQDNLREVAYQQLMEALARSGQREAALAMYDECRSLLYEELGMSPSRYTTRLAERIASGEVDLAPVQTPDVRGYELLEKVGSGAFGVVHRAYQALIGREVAIKIIQPEYANRPNFIRRFEVEAQTIARLEHPYIVPLYDYWREPDGAFLVMRYMRGGNLATAINRRGAWEPAAVLQLVDQLGSALATAHEQGIVHRDLKPANILLDEAGNVYLSDFGIARHIITEEMGQDAGDSAVLTSSPYYTSPEQLRGDPVTLRSDIYTFGFLLFELFTGRKPFETASLGQVLQQHLHGSLPSAHALNADLPVALDAVLQQATATDPDARFSAVGDLAESLYAALNGTVAPPPPALIAQIEGNPYKGLRAFQESDAETFFGRTALTNQLLDQLADANFLAVVGPSGSGKSSVVKAGLLPALRSGAIDGADAWFITEMVPGTRPLEELEAALMRVAVDPPASLIEPLEKDERGLVRILKRILPPESNAGRAATLLLVIDQFEELFTLVSEQARQHFLDNLLTALNEPRCQLHVVITLRADFYDRPLQLPKLAEYIKTNTVVITPLTGAELQETIVRPAALAGTRFEDGLVADIIDDVHDQPGMLPLLQYALTELFEQRQDDVMTKAAYAALGGIEGVLGTRAETLYADLSESEQMLTRQLFLRLVTLGEGVEDTRRRVLQSELEAIAEDDTVHPSARILQPFGAARLLSFDHDPATRTPTVEVAHEALLHEWPRLRQWLDESRADVRLQRLLAVAAAEWRQADQDDGYLLRGSRLEQFEGWSESAMVALTADERTFLAASGEARRRRQAAEEARRQSEIETAQQLAEEQLRRAEIQSRSVKLLRYLVSGLNVLAILAIAAAWLAINSQQKTQVEVEARSTAQAEAVAEANAKSTAQVESERSANLAATREVEALEQAAIAATREAEIHTESEIRATAEAIAIEERANAESQFKLARSRELAGLAKEALETDPELAMLLASEALSTAYTAEAESLLHQAVLASRVRQRLATGESNVWVGPVVPSPDGKYVAGLGNSVHVWSTESGERLFQVEPKPYVISFVDHFSFNSDSNRLVTSGPEENVTLSFWKVPSGELDTKLELPLPSEDVSQFVLSPDWSRIAIGYLDGTASLWSTDTGEKIADLNGHISRVGVAFSRDSQRLSSVDEQTAKVWDAATGEEQLSFPHSGWPLSSATTALSPDGNLLAIVVNTREIGIWDLEAVSNNPTDPARLTTLTGGHTLVPLGMNFSADGTKLVSGSRDQTARIWDPITGEELLVLPGGTSNVLTADFSSDMTQILTGSQDGTVKLWDITSSGAEQLDSVPLVPDAGAIALNPEETHLAVETGDGKVLIWDLRSKQILLTIEGHMEGIRDIEYSPDGRKIVTSSPDRTAIIWNATSGEPLLTLEGHGERISGFTWQGIVGVDYSSDGRKLATAGRDGTARIWDGETGTELLKLEHASALFDVKFSPDDRLLATASDEPDATLVLWDAVTGEKLFTLPQVHGDRIWMVDFNPDGTRMATSGGDGTIKIWQVDAAKMQVDLLATLLGHTGSAFGVVFSPDGQTLASNSTQLKLWDVSVLPAVNQDDPLATTLTTPRFTLPIVGLGSYLFTGDSSKLIYTFPTWNEEQYVARSLTLSIDELMSLAQARLTRSFTEEECLLYRIENCGVSDG
ncbi:MAG: protein kinase [Anaerolineae bacterium]|nr:protein kinase [Anaerolineae bacterium]